MAERWHSLEPDTVILQLDTDRSGLSSQEARSRLARCGANALAPPATVSTLKRFVLQFNNPLIYVLLVASLTTFLLRHWVDAGVILSMILIMAVIGAIQEGRAEHALQGIRRMLSHPATVHRDGESVRIDARELVYGDVVSLQSGDRVPADLRLLSARDLQVDESTLTGESTAVVKRVEAVADEAPVADWQCMAHSGTFVTSGRGLGVVVATGSASQIGRIATLAEGVKPEPTPLMLQMADLSKLLSVLIVGLATATFLFGAFYRDLPAGEMFVTAVALAVAAIPEGLPAIITITLAIGVQRMARRNSIIRHLPGVETLGAVTVVCSDKTGTLTLNEMMVRSIQLREQLIEVTGNGYDPHGEFRCDQRVVSVEQHPALATIAHIAVLCNDAVLEDGDQWHVQGDPTEGALIAMAIKAGLDPAAQRLAYPRSDEIPFESEHQLMATLHHDHAGHAWILVKGAPEKLLGLCTLQQSDGDSVVPLERDWWQERLQAMGSQGHRTLALARCETASSRIILRHEDLLDGLVLVGFVGISDPPRQDAFEAVAACRTAGIRVKMVTGDLPATARAIAGRFGLNTEQILSGEDLARMDEAGLRARVGDVDVYARTSPEQKLWLVRALQHRGEIVAMTGDGVNDAPALRQADIGVAMGRRGTEVAREASDMVLTDDNFTSIADAVREGRTVYDNIKKSILFMLPTGLAEAFVIVLATMAGFTLPLTAVQILWVNMITAVTLGIALAFEPPEADVMSRPPRLLAESSIRGHLGWRIAFVSLIMVSGTLLQFYGALEAGMTVEAARTVTVNTLVFFEVFYLFSSRRLLQPVLNWRGLTENPYVLLMALLMTGFQMLYTYNPTMHFLFSSAGLPAGAWLGILLTASSILFLVELEKMLLRSMQSRSRKPGPHSTSAPE